MVKTSILMLFLNLVATILKEQEVLDKDPQPEKFKTDRKTRSVCSAEGSSYCRSHGCSCYSRLIYLMNRITKI